MNVGLFIKYLGFQVALTVVFLLAEQLRPVEARQPAKNTLFNIQWVLFTAFVSRYLPLSLVPLVATAVHAWISPGWIELPTTGGWGIELIQWFLFIFSVDFFFVCTHRLEHTKWFWPVHVTHHSETSLNAAAAEVGHWVEGGAAWGLAVLATNLIFRFHFKHEGQLYTLILAWHLFTHMNLKVDFGRFNYMLTTPQYHRIHHSRYERHFDLCFAGFFPVIDMLFGTFYAPLVGEFPPTGIPALVEGRTFLGANLAPFKLIWRTAGSALSKQGLHHGFGDKTGSEVLPTLGA